MNVNVLVNKTTQRISNMTYEALTAAKMSALVSSVVTPFGLVEATNVSEERTASIFRTEDRHRHPI
jgi:hypothetical protein